MSVTITVHDLDLSADRGVIIRAAAVPSEGAQLYEVSGGPSGVRHIFIAYAVGDSASGLVRLTLSRRSGAIIAQVWSNRSSRWDSSTPDADIIATDEAPVLVSVAPAATADVTACIRWRRRS